MNFDVAKKKIDEEEDFIYSKRFDFSLKKALERYPDGMPPKMVAQALLMSEEEVEALFQKILLKIRKEMKVDLD